MSTLPSRKLSVKLLYVQANRKFFTNTSLMYIGSRIAPLTLKKNFGALRKTQQLRLAQSQVHHRNPFKLLTTGVLISHEPDQEGNKLQACPNFHE
jgi:hypothetical protein